MAAWQEGGAVAEEDDALFLTADSAFAMGYSNAVFPLSHSGDPAWLLERAEAVFGPLKHRYLLWVRDDIGRELEELARSRDMLLVSELPAMVVSGGLEQRPVPAGLELRRLHDDKGLADFIAVSKDAYATLGVPPELWGTLFTRSADLFSEDVAVVVAYAGERPVSAAMSVSGPEGGGVYWVGSRSDARRGGGGEACTRAVTRACFDRRAAIVALEASPMGAPIYRRMGFETLFRYRWYMSPAP
jgi:hypothetical protein